jgi:hypothetical protein
MVFNPLMQIETQSGYSEIFISHPSPSNKYYLSKYLFLGNFALYLD